MRNLASLLNWCIWLLIVPAVTFLLSLVFQFSYLECVQSAPYAVTYGLYFIMITGLYLSTTDADSRPMDFL